MANCKICYMIVNWGHQQFFKNIYLTFECFQLKLKVQVFVNVFIKAELNFKENRSDRYLAVVRKLSYGMIEVFWYFQGV